MCRPNSRGPGADQRGARPLDHHAGEVTFLLDDAAGSIELTHALAAEGVGIRALVREEETLEQLFFRLTEPDGSATHDAAGVSP